MSEEEIARIAATAAARATADVFDSKILIMENQRDREREMRRGLEENARRSHKETIEARGDFNVAHTELLRLKRAAEVLLAEITERPRSPTLARAEAMKNLEKQIKAADDFDSKQIPF